jgi:putative aldouronate transport system substrate-binding protein
VAADAQRFQTEQMVNFVTGKRPLSEFEAFVNELNTQFNYKAYLDAATTQLTELGLVK